MASLNKACLLGYVGQDPEIKHLRGGSMVANLSLATSDTWRDKQTGERKERTEWHRLVVFNEGLIKTIEQYVKKGQQLYVEGQIQTRKWEDKDGKDRYSTEIVLGAYGATLLMVGKAGDRDNPKPEGRGTGGARKKGNNDDMGGDTIPF